MRICIVTPGALGSNPRVVKEATALHDTGHDVYVISIRTLPHLEFCDRQVLAAAPWRANRLDLNKSRYRIERLAQLASKSTFRAVPLPVFADRSISASTRLLTKRAESVHADLYIAHYVAALPAAARAATRYGAAYAFDAEDFHLGDLPDTPEHALDKQIIRAIESRYLPGAAYLTAAAPLIADAYTAAYGVSRPAVILNVFPKLNAPTAPTACGSANPGPSVYWFSQTIGPGRGLETAIEAIAKAKSAPHLYLRGTPAAGYDKYLRSFAMRAGAAEQLHFLDPVQPNELERFGAQYDLGYVGELAESRNRQIALTNKVFSYLLSGVPSIATDIPAHRQIAPELGEAMTLFRLDDAAALASAIDNALLYPQRLAAARAHAWHLGQTRYNWDVELASLTHFVEKAVAC
jgi:glycosyltransferase involved in cell wall biosynthesis